MCFVEWNTNSHALSVGEFFGSGSITSVISNPLALHWQKSWVSLRDRPDLNIIRGQGINTEYPRKWSWYLWINIERSLLCNKLCFTNVILVQNRRSIAVQCKCRDREKPFPRSLINCSLINRLLQHYGNRTRAIIPKYLTPPQYNPPVVVPDVPVIVNVVFLILTLKMPKWTVWLYNNCVIWILLFGLGDRKNTTVTLSLIMMTLIKPKMLHIPFNYCPCSINPNFTAIYTWI